jgi:hypothetical protein
LLFFLLAGVAFWIAIPDIYIGQIWVGVSLLLALIFGLLFAKQRGEQKVMTEGIQGTAQILGMTQTGVQVNEQPQVELHMRVEAPGLKPYELRKKFVVPLIALGQLSGGRLTVAIDREDQENVVVNWGQALAGGQVTAPMTVSTQDGRSFELGADADVQKEVFAILEKHGLATSGALDLRQHPQARAEMIALLESKGHDAGPATPGATAAPATPTPAGAPPQGPAQPEKASPAERLEELRKLKEEGLVSEEEYESKRIQIISEF